ncbi:hypothetical protein EUX98_g1093 [Antrodiella citrinella]|uniref:Protein kinase domain-containing protein n=1 Tax=Antrodiella citrinella TaxID=2447956 RepID=A0A4S4N2A5_9APHY|nr:hypothetical protein EUX98_g1093 [Antrodiella citrinella]
MCPPSVELKIPFVSHSVAAWTLAPDVALGDLIRLNHNDLMLQPALPLGGSEFEVYVTCGRTGVYVDGDPLPVRSEKRLYHRCRLRLHADSGEKLDMMFQQLNFGSMLSLYDVGELSLGSGGYGSVHKAQERASGLIVAIKSVRSRAFRGSKGSITLPREIDIGLRLEHVNVIETRDAFRDEQHFLLELAPFGNAFTAHEILGNFDQETVRAISKDACNGLAYLHSMNILHRDVKPDNLLFMSLHPIVVKIADLGLAKRLTEGDAQQTLCGTEMYMAPEISALSTPYDLKIDCWSFGVTVFTL